jgi:hypothetical protein
MARACIEPMFLICSKTTCKPPGMPDHAPMRPATPDEIAETLAFVLRYLGPKWMEDTMSRIMAGTAVTTSAAVRACDHEGAGWSGADPVFDWITSADGRSSMYQGLDLASI